MLCCVLKVMIYAPYLPVFEEVQCYLYILQFVESHAAFLSGLRIREEIKMVFTYMTRLSDTIILVYSWQRIQQSVKMVKINRKKTQNPMERHLTERINEKKNRIQKENCIG